MSMKPIYVSTPFKVCEKCEHLSIDETILYGDGTIYAKTYSCENMELCENFAKLVNYTEESE